MKMLSDQWIPLTKGQQSFDIICDVSPNKLLAKNNGVDSDLQHR